MVILVLVLCSNLFISNLTLLILLSQYTWNKGQEVIFTVVRMAYLLAQASRRKCVFVR
jgi:hypothetical protein